MRNFLIFAALALAPPPALWGQAALSVGTVTGAPGGTVDLPINFTAGSGTSALQFDLSLPAALTYVSTATGGAASAAGKTAQGRGVSASVARVLVYGGNQELATGTIALVRVSVAAGAATGNLSVGISAIVAADFRSLAVSVPGTAGGVNVAPGNVPRAFEGGVVNGASFTPRAPVAAGSIASLFGERLANSLAVAETLPLPTLLAGARVQVNGIAAPLFFVSAGQINFQVPVELTGAAATVVVERDGLTSVPIQANLSSTAPGIFTQNQQGTGPAAVLNAAGRPVSAANPARVGDVVQIFCTGLGATNPPAASGRPAPGAEPLARVTAPVEVRFGNIVVPATFAGLAPGFVGLYQVNAQVPAGITPGPSVSLRLILSGMESSPVTIAVQ